MAKSVKDWDKIMREYSSPEASDAEDELNIQSVKKNTHRIAEMFENLSGLKDNMRNPPMGMNRLDDIRDGLAASALEVSHRKDAQPNSSETSTSPTTEAAEEEKMSSPPREDPTSEENHEGV